MYPLEPKKKLLGDKLRKFINIKKKLILKKNQIYKFQKDRLNYMINNFSFEGWIGLIFEIIFFKNF